VRHCETHWPAGPDWGNARVHDIMQFYVSCLEECIAACASYNRNYQNNVASGIGHYEGGLCRAVTVIKTREYYSWPLFPGGFLFAGVGMSKSAD
jgi:hypothetical protein